MGTGRQKLKGVLGFVVLVLALCQPYVLPPSVANPGPQTHLSFDTATGTATDATAIDALLAQAKELYDREDYGAARALYEQALVQAQALDYGFALATAKHYIARFHGRAQNYAAALSLYFEVLDTLSTLGIEAPAQNREVNLARADKLRADTNFQLAKLYASTLDDNRAALPFLEEALTYYQAFEPASITLGDALNGLGYIRESLGDLGDALRAYGAALEVYRRLMDIDDQAAALNNIGGLRVYLGEYRAAQLALEEALVLLETTPRYGDYRVFVLNNLGWLYERQYRYDDALTFYRAAKTARTALGQGVSVSRLLSNIAYVHTRKNELEVALAHYREALTVTDGSPQIAERIEIFNGIGATFFKQEKYDDVWENYHRSLRSSLQIERSLGQARTLIELGRLLQTVQEPLAAIAFYKQAINAVEQVRSGLRSLPLETQQRYTDTVADSYRELAALLLRQDRGFEAQQVLDLLKIQELEDYLHDVRVDRPQLPETIPYLPPEQELLAHHHQLLLAGRADTDPVLSLGEFLRRREVRRTLKILRHRGHPQLQPESLKHLQTTLKSSPYPSAALYPLVLDDRLELLLVPPAGRPIHKTTLIDKTTLASEVNALRTALADPSSDVKKLASPLYEAIIRPFQRDLQTLGIENLVYIPDNVLHYIPLATLYDNRQQRWLVEQYTSHNLTAGDIGDLTQTPRRPLTILAGAFADPSQTFVATIEQKTTHFNGLTYAGQEVSFLRNKLPTTQILLDADFSRNNLETRLNGRNILHLATHAAFVPGQPEASFILLGDGDTITLKELRHLPLPNVDLVVLSACQTGISHIEDGLEILSMGFQVQRTDARAALASLWWVDDRSTAQLMQHFYTELAAGAPKVKALQKAQRYLIARGRDEPFHWAPFVLIGNGL